MNLTFELVCSLMVIMTFPVLAYGFRSVSPSRFGRALATLATTSDTPEKASKGKLLVLGGTGFLGQTVCKRAVLEGYSVVSLSRRGLPPTDESMEGASSSKIDYRKGDARQKESISNILADGGFTGLIHCVGLLLDDSSGFGDYNKFFSGSGSLPDSKSTYDTITRLTGFNAIDSAIEYAEASSLQDFPVCFTSAAEAGWPEVAGGEFIEQNLAPDFLKRYLVAKRAVESKLMGSQPTLRPIIARPSLIYSLDRPASYVPVGAFFVGNKIGLPFVDRPVTVQALSAAMVRAIERKDVSGVLRYDKIDELSP